MNILEAAQGSPAWHAHRARHYNASDASAVLGLSRYKTRQQLMREKATGIVPEVDEATQRRFDKGHEFEAIARPWAEEIIGAELFPVVLAGNVDGLPLSASLDGLTMLEDVAFEHKTGRADLLASLEAGVIPDEYKPQMEQCLLLSGATKCLFMASSGNREAMRFAWYESDPVVRKNLLAGWAMFDADLAEYRHTEPAREAVAEPQMALPSVSIQVNGSIALIDNLDVFGEALTAYVERINKKPETDDDFATLEATVKNLKKAEDALDAAENGALAQAASIDTMRRTVATLRDMARSNRLLIDKLVKAEKENRKAQIISEARKAMFEHVDKLNERIGGRWMPVFTDAIFAEAVAGLKSLDSMRDKVAGALANAKIEANEIADRVQINLTTLEANAEHKMLFPDFAQLITKPNGDFMDTVNARIAAHKAAEAEKAEATKKAEEARIAAAVEAERQAGEARAAAAVEAERAASLTANNQTQFEDQRGKAEADAEAANVRAFDGGTSLDSALAGASKATTIPAGHFVDANKMVQPDEALIDDFLKCRAISPADKKALRVHLVAWETYRVKREMAVAA